jgi:hypothetical protein
MKLTYLHLTLMRGGILYPPHDCVRQCLIRHRNKFAFMNDAVIPAR